VQNRIDKACARSPSIRETVAGGSAARSLLASVAAAGTCYPEKFMAVWNFGDR
jgi:hypothetical protein